MDDEKLNANGADQLSEADIKMFAHAIDAVGLLVVLLLVCYKWLSA